MEMQLSIFERKVARSERTNAITRGSPGPTIFHITLHKAGSQWIRHLLSKCAPERIVQPDIGGAAFLKHPIKEGHIYPALCITKRDFDRVSKPKNSKRFVILRDLRDVLVSAYFSLKYSHPEQGEISEIRESLNAMSSEEGMLWLLKGWLSGEAKIFSSWLNSRENWIRYEDLLENDIAILEDVLIDQCCLNIDRALFREHVLSCRFAHLSGRIPGQEDIHSHYRKGIAGDWRNHFSPKIKRIFKWLYGSLLVQSGYEKNDRWE
jgi:Sulfotransferase domain